MNTDNFDSAKLEQLLLRVRRNAMLRPPPPTTIEVRYIEDKKVVRTRVVPKDIKFPDRDWSK